MLRSMFTAITSLNLHQDYLDVIADNLANANTTGYKSSRVVFQDQFAQILSYGSSPTANQGGVNPTQIGLGVKAGYISPLFTQGALESTGRNTDLAVQGDGFFIYGSGTYRRYSREGALEIDSNGNLVNSSTGFRIQGWQADANGNINLNQAIGDIQVPLNATLAQATTNAIMSGNFDSDTALNGTITGSVAVYDSLGNPTSVPITFTRTTNNTAPVSTVWTWAAGSPATAGSGTITFDSAGQVTGTTTTANITFPGANGASATSFSLDLTGITMLSDDTSVAMTTQNGLAAGTYSEVNVEAKTGVVYVVYSNGLKEKVGQVALARFTNPSGLIRDGSNLFKEGLNSGTPQVGASLSNGRGAIASGYLEASNVDMAQEFTNMILAQRGFQASSRIITTSDEILQELVNLNR